MARGYRTIRMELSDADLSEAVTAWAAAKGIAPDVGESVRVTLEVTTRSVGYGMNERDEPVATVVLTVSSKA